MLFIRQQHYESFVIAFDGFPNLFTLYIIYFSLPSSLSLSLAFTFPFNLSFFISLNSFRLIFPFFIVRLFAQLLYILLIAWSLADGSQLNRCISSSFTLNAIVTRTHTHSIHYYNNTFYRSELCPRSVHSFSEKSTQKYSNGLRSRNSSSSSGISNFSLFPFRK